MTREEKHKFWTGLVGAMEGLIHSLHGMGAGAMEAGDQFDSPLIRNLDRMAEHAEQVRCRAIVAKHDTAPK